MARLISALAASALLLNSPVSAANIGPFSGSTTRPGVTATVGISIPLGGRRGSVDTPPRAELRFGGAAPVSLQPRTSPSLRAVGLRGTDSVAPAPAVLALTFGEKTRWYAGGRPLGADQDETPEDDDGIDTLEGIGIGVGVVLAVGAAAVAYALVQIGNCDRDCN